LIRQTSILSWCLLTISDPKNYRLKVSKEMFILFLPQLVRYLNARGFDSFFDLKFNDIP
jgi:orotidine-5'-phosphate decarboxylase